MDSNGDRQEINKPSQTTAPKTWLITTLVETASNQMRKRRRKTLNEELARRRRTKSHKSKVPTIVVGQLATLETIRTICLLFLLLIILVQPNRVESTSNVNSVWLPGEQNKPAPIASVPTPTTLTTWTTAGVMKHQRQPLEIIAPATTIKLQHQPRQKYHSKLQRANETAISSSSSSKGEQSATSAAEFSSRSGEWRRPQHQNDQPAAGDDRLATGPLLAASSSSLEPSIVDLEQADVWAAGLDDYASRSISRRRSDSEPTATNFLGGFLGNSSSSSLSGDDASSTSVDNLWNLNQTNAHVQFDEEHANQAANKLAVGSTNQQQAKHQRGHRDVTETNTTLAPQYTIGGGSSWSPSPLSAGQQLGSGGPMQAPINATMNNNGRINSTASSHPILVSSFLDSSAHSEQQQYNGNSLPSPLPAQVGDDDSSLVGLELSSSADNNEEYDKRDGADRRPDEHRQPPALVAGPGSNADRKGHANNTKSGEQHSTYVYYLQDGDKWNSGGAYEQPAALANPPLTTGGSTNQRQVEFESKQAQSAAVARASANTSNNGRRKLHNSGTQYDLREREQQSVNLGANSLKPSSLESSSSRPAQMAGQQAAALAAAAEAMSAALDATDAGGNSGNARFQAAQFGQMPANLKTIDRWPQEPPSLNAQVARSAGSGGGADLQGAPTPFYALQSASSQQQHQQPATFGEPAYLYSPHEYLQGNSQHQLSQLQQLQHLQQQLLTGAAAAAFSQRESSPSNNNSNDKQKLLTRLPQQSTDSKRQDVSLLVLGRPQSDRQTQPARSSSNRLRPLAPIFLTGDSGHGAHNNHMQRSLLRGVPMLNYISRPQSQPNGFNLQPNSNSKARKSLLGSLGSRLNNWAAESTRDQQKSLESAFYEQDANSDSPDRGKRRLRTQTNAKWNINQQQQQQQRSNRNHKPYTPTYYNQQQQFSDQFGQQALLAAGGLLRPPMVHFPLPYPTIGRFPAAGNGGSESSSALSGAYLSRLHTLQGGGVQQPTVAPAPSSLGRYYGQQSAPGVTSSAASVLNSQFYLHPSSQQQLQHRVRRFPPAADSSLGGHHLSQFAANKGPLGGGDTSGARQQQASAAAFIPVVAVSVTKTSPAPRPAEQHQQQQQQQQSSEPSPSDNNSNNSEIDEYLELKTGAGGSRHNNNRYNVQNSLDDYGNVASGSVTRDSSAAFRGPRQPSGNQQQAVGGEHTTTVKSAVFGYLPHQAESPMMQAISMLPQYSANKLAHLPGYNLQSPSADLPGGQAPLDSSSSSSLDSANQFGGALDEPPSLALQLQANNLVQNDIAHPFYDHSAGGVSLGNKAAVAAALQSAAMQQQQQTMRPSLLAVRNPFDSAPVYSTHPSSQYGGLQLLPAAATDQQQHHAAASLMGNAHFLAAASELNPLLPELHMFAADPASMLHNHKASGQHWTNNQDGQQAAGGGSSSSSAEGQDSQEFASQSNQQQQQQQQQQDDADYDGQSTSPTRQQSQVNSKANKKRSSDFFASAGQLLLSALPLLLAPTLGLMFAASAPNPIARYHGANAFGANSALGSSSSSSSHPVPGGASLNGLGSLGMVSNASPTPQLFTPTPPEYMTRTTLGPRVATTSSTTTARPTTARPAPTRAASSANPHHRPPETTLAHFPAAAKGNSSLTLMTATTSSPAASMKSFGDGLTTLGPPPFVVASNDSSGDQIDFDNSSSLVDHLTGNTIILMAPNSSPDSFFNASESKLNQQQQYDVSYQGVDFDAQFASLRKQMGANSHHKASGKRRNKPQQQRQQLLTSYDRSRLVNYHQVTLPPDTNKTGVVGQARQQPMLLYTEMRPFKEKHQYQYSEVSPDSSAPNSTAFATEGNRQKGTNSRSSNTSSGSFEGEAKLYPVSTWPAMRRRTVSLVTSSGNRTLYDASDRYSTAATSNDSLAAFTGYKPTSIQHHQQQHQRRRFTSPSSDEDDLNGDESRQRNVVASSSSSRSQPEEVEFVVSTTTGTTSGEQARSSDTISTQRAARAVRTRRETSAAPSLTESSAPISLEGGRRMKRVVRKIKMRQSGDHHQQQQQQLNSPSNNDNLVRFHVGSPHNRASPTLSSGGKSIVGNESSLESSESSQPRSLSTVNSPEFGHQHASPPPPPPPPPSSASFNGGRRAEFLLKQATHAEQRQPVAADIYREPLKRDASKSKHIITTMIAHMNNPASSGDDDDNDSDNDANSFPAKSGAIEEEVDSDGSYSRGSNYRPRAYSSSSSDENLRNQLLRKKVMLDRLASSSSFVQPDEEEEAADYYALDPRSLLAPTPFNRRLSSTEADSRMIRERLTRFQAPLSSRSGDSQLPPPPIEVTSTKIRLYPNGTEPGGRGRRKSGALILTDETKKALANFGSLLIKDTLEIPQYHKFADQGSRGRVFARQSPRSKSEQELERPDGYESSATEQSFTRTTPFPDLSAGYQEPAHFARLRGEDYVNRTFPLLEPILPSQGEPVDSQRRFHPPASRRVPSPPIRERVNLLENESPNYNSFGDDSRPEDGVGGSGGYPPTSVYLAEQGDNSRYSSGNQAVPPALIDEPSMGGPYNSPASNRYGGAGDYNYTSDPYSHNQTMHPTVDSYPYSGGQQQQGYASHYGHPPARPQQPAQYASSAYEAGSGAGRGYQPPPGYSLNGHEQADSHHHQQQQHQQYFNSNHSGLPYSAPTYHQKSQGANNNYDHQSQQRMNYNHHASSNSDDYGYAKPPLPHHLSVGAHSPLPPTQAPSKYPSGGYQQPQDSLEFRYSQPSGRPDRYQHQHHPHQQQHPHHQAIINQHAYQQQQPMMAPQPPPPPGAEYYTQPKYALAASQRNQPPDLPPPLPPQSQFSSAFYDGGLGALSAASDKSDSKAVNEYLKRVQFSDSDRDKLMASYLTCDGLLNDNDHCLERLSCEFSDPQNIEKANKLDRAVSSILLGHILINTYIPNQFKLRLKSASLFGYTQSGKCSRYVCNKLTKSSSSSSGATFDSAAGAASAA